MGLEFLSTGWLYAAPAFIAALILLYFLKLKRREVVISSTFLWHRALNDLRVNSPLQRLRMNLLLLLQLLALIALLAALARPVSNIGGLEGSDSILLIDVSASMQATDGGGESRLESAVAQAQEIVDDLPRGDRAMVIAFHDDVEVKTDMTDSKVLLSSALSDLEATDRSTRLGPAIHRVRALLNAGERSPELYVFSDGRVGALEGVALEENVPVHFRPVGDETDNVGIVGIDVAMATGLGDDTRVFVSVQNSGKTQETVGVDFFIDDELIDSRELSLAGRDERHPDGGVGSAPFEVPLFDDGRKFRRVRVALDNKDALAMDDTAYAVVGERNLIKVLLVTGGNLFLHSALNEDPLIFKTPRGDVPLLAPENFDPDDPALREYDVIVLDRFSPERLRAGNYLCFGARPPLAEFEDTGQMENTRVLDWDETHETTRFVNFATLVLPVARRFKLGERHDVVVRGTGGPIVVDAREGDRRAIVCSFDLLSFPVEGAWTFDPSFPIFLANTIRALGGSGEDKRKGSLVRTGATGELHFPPSAVKASVSPPKGEPYTLPILQGDEVLYLTRLDHAGVYVVTFKDDKDADVRVARFAVNMVDAEESVIEPEPRLVLENREVVGEEEELQSKKDMWKLVAGLALCFVMLEWWLYNRRVYL